jgi:hypothetical protein
MAKCFRRRYLREWAMKVDGINQPNGHAYGLEKPHPQTPATTELTTHPPDDQSDTHQTKGVISLLQEGHFKGVADVRLRIIFNDELTAIESDQLKTAAEENIEGLLTALAATTAPEALTEAPQLQQTFTDAVQQAKNDFLSAEPPSKADLIASLNAAFQAFIEGLWTNFAPATGPAEGLAAGQEETGGETEDAIESGEEETPAQVGLVGQEGGESPEPAPETAPATELDPQVTSYIAGLEAAFETAMNELIGAVDGVAVLPELSQPSGNGVAYDKFLAIYNQLRGLQVPTEGSEGTEAIDATA